MQIIETNAETGETIEREATAEEQAKHDAELALVAEMEAQYEATRLAKESAIAKFQAMGLTEEEVRSLVG